MMHDLPARINANLRAEMGRTRTTQAQLAAALDLSQSSLSRRLNGEADWTVPELFAAADALGCPVAHLLQEAAA